MLKWYLRSDFQKKNCKEENLLRRKALRKIEQKKTEKSPKRATKEKMCKKKWASTELEEKCNLSFIPGTVHWEKVTILWEEKTFVRIFNKRDGAMVWIPQTPPVMNCFGLRRSIWFGGLAGGGGGYKRGGQNYWCPHFWGIWF